jgi:Asp-tRNA(Asn)/Glu-tRNA(Gln) amidotransferase A subunit family amidase
MAKVVLAIMLKHWPAEMWMRLIEPQEMKSFVPEGYKAQLPQGQKVQPNPIAVENAWKQAIDTIANKGMSIIDLDVKVAAGSTMPTNRIAKRAEAVEMVKAGIYDVRAALEYVDDPKANEVAERMEQQQEMAALQGMKK